MPHHLIRKLQQFVRLSRADGDILAEVTSRRIRTLRVREDIIREGDGPVCINLVLDGFACRHKTLPDGRRQILAFIIPGDLCDMHAYLLRQMDHSISTLSAVRLAQISSDDLIDMMDRHPRLAKALWWNTLVDEAVLREWTVNLGQRSGIERVAHLLCELFVRLQGAGLVKDGVCPFPITQTDLSDALGISVVHTNRMLQELRSEGLIVLRNRTLEVVEFARLKSLAMFSPAYLHLDHEGRQFDSNEDWDHYGVHANPD